MIIEQPPSNRSFDYLLKEHEQEWWIEFKTGTRSTRDLRAQMISLAMNLYKNQEKPANQYAVLIIISPEMTEKSISDEWLLFHEMINVQYRNQLSLLTWMDGELEHVFPRENLELPLDTIHKLVKEESKPKKGKLPQADFNHTITTLLIKNLFNKNAFLKSKDLQHEAGCSYPTLQRILKKVDPWIERDSSRSLRMKRFPEDLWWKLLSNAPMARHTVTFQDVSGQPRSIESLIKRLDKLVNIDWAIGGVMAALHHLPKLDIVGSPRLDLTIHVKSFARYPQQSFSASRIAEQIDPGLEETSDPTKPVRLAIHYLRRATSDFVKDESTGCWLTDPVECLYDLHDAKLIPQAEQLLNHLKHQH